MAFDVAAASYDTDFSYSPIGVWLRQRIHQRLERLFQPNQTVLEIGCGTGEDALWLAQQGLNVVATDASPAMLDIAQRKIAAAGAGDRVTYRLLDLNALPLWDDLPLFDGVFSNFGPLNCTADYTGLRDFLAGQLRVGAKVGFGVMSPFCLWESVWHSAHLDFKTAFRRRKRQQQATLVDGSQLAVYYPSPRQLSAALAPTFQRRGVIGVGVWLPPSDSFGVLEARPNLLKWFYRMEKWTAHGWPFRTWADHYWLELDYV